ncbi:oligogalacturonate-specific porin KdgM family protein [Akkermansia glycaniphila]|uniref:Oligogalacturonate-specific porin protein (Kdgm) n=1 Tax=Akkermansia glycaniphila TaxID=1679444 RepID=A0A1H6KNI7_9BACT|nr:oligogalacturonate-specific porin KdgM family protein [Akkermansia glycaniphila]SEH77280.1 oligogalacturonate-specific porin protein (kdgm) [Akkermansia glycaniphila]
MKNTFFLMMLGIGAVSANVQASSLYDVTPSVGLLESSPLKWSFTLSAGYDDNVNAVAKSNPVHESSSYVGFSLGSSYSNQDARTQLSYNALLGGDVYTRNMHGRTDQVIGNSSLSMQLTHAFDSTLRYTMHNSVAYTPDPNYADGISASRRQGNTFTFNTSHTVGKSLDPRWALNTNVSYSGILYSESEYQDDNREYVNIGESLSFKASERTSYLANASGQFVLRQEGYNSQNIYTTVGIQHALSPRSNVSMNVGTQIKIQQGAGTKVYPTLSGGYNRVVTDSMSISCYVSYNNESVGTYYDGRNYGSNSTWRLGVNCTQKLTHVLSLNYGASAMFSDYSDGEAGLGDHKETTYNFNVGLSWRLDRSWSVAVGYAYTNADLGGFSTPYTRNVYSINTTYTF